MKRINKIQTDNEADITGENQHGFKHERSTSTLAVKLQSLIARALDEDKYVLVASLDLSSAFDVVDINLLILRLKRIGLPEDVVQLISEWLKDRFYFVSIDGENSILYDLLLGTVQGSILGPVLYAIFVSPLFDIEPLLAFADDSYIMRENSNINELIEDLQKSLEAITKWLKKSGMKVNQSKTELCLFYKRDCAPIDIVLNETKTTSKSVINVLGVLFDCKVQWNHHVSNTIRKSQKALNAIKIIRKYFNSNELLQLLTSNFYSILYYNSEVWHLPSLHVNLKKKYSYCISKRPQTCPQLPPV